LISCLNWDWDRMRDCHDDDCLPCTGIGGIPKSDKNEDIIIPNCTVLKTAEEIYKENPMLSIPE